MMLVALLSDVCLTSIFQASTEVSVNKFDPNHLLIYTRVKILCDVAGWVKTGQ